MAEWKKVIVSGSNISELNNDSNYLSTQGGGILSGSAEGDAQGQIKLNGVNVDANALGSGDSPQFVTVTAALSGNATTATTLESSRNIGGVAFNGSANIDLPGVNTAGNQDTTGTANTASYVTGASVDGSVATATALASSQNFSATGDVTATAVSFDGTGAVALAMGIATGAVDNVHFAAATKTAISGAFTSTSSSFAADIAALQVGAYDLNIIGDSGTGVITNAESLDIAGGDDITTVMSGNELTINLDSSITADVTGDLTGTADTASYVASSAIDGDIALGSGTSGNYVATVTGGTGLTSTGAVSGEGIAHSLSVDYGTSSTTALRGDTTIDDVSVSNLKTRLAGGFGSNAVAIGDSDDIVTIGNDLVVTGNLTVNGDNLVANVTNLAVDDRYILLNSGSAAGDSGIVFGGSLGTANSGMAIILDDTDDRLVIRSDAFDPDSNSDATLSAANHYSVVGAFEGTVANAATAKANKVGNIRVESEDIFIYV